jgi:hypothetical protein
MLYCAPIRYSCAYGTDAAGHPALAVKGKCHDCKGEFKCLKLETRPFILLMEWE